MAKILIKNSVTAGSTPSGLSFGELAVNIADKKIFIGNAVQGVVTIHDQQNVVTSVNGQTGDVTVTGSSSTGVTGIVAGSGIAVSGQTGNVTITNTGVLSINGSTGAITNVARINEGNTFSVLQVMNAGVTSANLYVSGGATFNTIYTSSTTNNIDILSSTNGIGLRVAQNVGGGAASVGGIRLGRSSTTALNYLLYAASGTFYIINGISGTDAQLMTLNSVDANFNVPIRGATFSSSVGRITVQKSIYSGSDSGTVRIVGADAANLNVYSSDIRANTDAAADTIHTLPAVTGTLLNTASSYVTGVNGITGPVGLSAGSNITITLSGKTLTIASTASGGGATGATGPTGPAGSGVSEAFVIAMAIAL